MVDLPPNAQGISERRMPVIITWHSFNKHNLRLLCHGCECEMLSLGMPLFLKGFCNQHNSEQRREGEEEVKCFSARAGSNVLFVIANYVDETSAAREVNRLYVASHVEGWRKCHCLQPWCAQCIPRFLEAILRDEDKRSLSHWHNINQSPGYFFWTTSNYACRCRLYRDRLCKLDPACIIFWLRLI